MTFDGVPLTFKKVILFGVPYIASLLISAYSQHGGKPSFRATEKVWRIALPVPEECFQWVQSQYDRIYGRLGETSMMLFQHVVTQA